MKNLLIASKPGTGKSKMAVDIAVDLVKKHNINIMFAVPDGKIAVETRQRFKDEGIKAFILSSHESIFAHQKKPPKEFRIADFDCPFYEEIQHEIKLGVPSSAFKEEYCGNCPFADKCYFPDQYTQVMDDEYQVVIIQHAHFSTSEVIYKLLTKKFKLMFIDETFIKNIFESIKVSQTELDLIEAKGFGWSVNLFNWLMGTRRAIGEINAPREELEALEEDYKTFKCNWRIPDLIRFYNQKRLVNEFHEIEIVYEIPAVPIRVFTDATPPVELIKHLTGIDNLEVYGADEIIDIKAINPGNRRYQIYNVSNSVTKMKDEEFFTALMTKSCQIIKENFINKKSLFTVYKADKVRVDDFIILNYPEILPFVDIGVMSKGTNKWATYDFQIILAGRYRKGREYYEDAYKYRSIANYHRIKNGLPEFINPYPSGLSDDTAIKIQPQPVRMLQRVDEELMIVEMPGFLIYPPDKQTDLNNDYYWFGLIDKLDVGEMAQCERLRWVPETAKLCIHAHSRFMEDLEVEGILFEEFLNL